MALKCGHCGGTNLGPNFGFFSTKVQCKDCGATTCYKNPSGKLKWVKGGKDSAKNRKPMTREWARSESEERMAEKIMDSKIRNIDKIDWWTGEGSGKI